MEFLFTKYGVIYDKNVIILLQIQFFHFKLLLKN